MKRDVNSKAIHMIEKSLKLLFLILKLNNEIAIVFIPDSTIEEIRMNLIQAFSPPNKVWISVSHPCAGWG